MPRSSNGNALAARLGGARRSLATAALLALAAMAAVDLLPIPAVAAGDGAAEPTSREAKSRAAIDGLVKELGSDDFDAREAATESLVALGAAARPALEEALSSDDPEVRARAERCLREIEAKDGVETPARAEGEPDPGRRSRSRLFPSVPRSGRLDLVPDPNELIERLEREFLEGDRFAPFFERGSGLLGGSVHIRIREDGRSWTYTEDPEKGVEARVTEPNAEDEVITARDRAEFVREHPALAKRLGLDETGAPPGALSDRRFSLRRGAPFAPLRPAGARLGVAVEPVGAALARQLELPEGVEGGVVVLEVEGGSPADALGLEPDDVIVAFEGEPIGDAAALRRAVRGVAAGDAVRIEIVRSGERRVVEGRF